ncbi:RelE/StbE replicon stabilization toxin [uncultured Leptolyngbya sp.]|uniref:RelE/StbE replicon stabilization toxin n=1 Tax=uncultured Leptolyngbya sp. TaxID=332963 RepID=A0A6J4LAH8_9CYAN|nr:RelE/StbE replicon stabilization toxin [uncultured Leptolyngbya sp.]
MASFHIEFLPTARKELASLPKQIQKRIAAKVNSLEFNPRPAGAKALKNGAGRLRLRVGDYRIIYRVEDDRLVVLVIKVGHRKDVYK